MGSNAEQLYDSGKEVTVEKLLELDAEIKNLKEKIAQFEKTSQESSIPPSSDRPCDRPPKKAKINIHSKAIDQGVDQVVKKVIRGKTDH